MIAKGFADVDRTSTPSEFIEYLDAASALEAVAAYKRLTIARLGVKAGDRVLDVGCGTGDDVAALAAIVQPTGTAVGIDASSAMIAEARRRAARAVLLVADVQRLPFDDESFDRCRADRTLMHVADVDLALAEMVRVTGRGGRIVVSEPDWETLVIDAEDRALTRQLANTICDSHRNGWIGRQLAGKFKEGGLVDITIDPATLVMTDRRVADHLFGLGSAIQDRELEADLERRSSEGRFFASLTGFIVAGRKP